MDFKALCVLLHERTDSGPNSEMGALQRSIAQLMLTLSAAIPEKAMLFKALVDDMQSSMFVARKGHHNVLTYFSGDGPVATKIREHVSIADWVDKAINPPIPNYGFGGEGTLSKIPPSAYIKDQLGLFNFHPIQSGPQVQEMHDYIMGVRAKLDAAIFMSPGPDLPFDQIQIEKLETGVYASTLDPKSVSVILRGVVPDSGGLEVLMCSVAGHSPTIWYYHPYEMVWLNSSFTVTFPGVLETLKAQFDVAMRTAGKLDQAFDFDTEMQRIETRVNEIFDDEDSLPPTVYYYPHGVSPKPLPMIPIGSYVRSGEGSLMIFAVERYNLIFRNSKGKYPLRTTSLCTNLTSQMQMSVEPSSLSDEEKRQLIHKAGLTIVCLTDVINNSVQ